MSKNLYTFKDYYNVERCSQDIRRKKQIKESYGRPGKASAFAVCPHPVSGPDPGHPQLPSHTATPELQASSLSQIQIEIPALPHLNSGCFLSSKIGVVGVPT